MDGWETSGATQVSSFLSGRPAAASFLSFFSSFPSSSSSSSRPPDFDGDCVLCLCLVGGCGGGGRRVASVGAAGRQMRGDLHPPTSAPHVNRDVIRSSAGKSPDG